MIRKISVVFQAKLALIISVINVKKKFEKEGQR